LNPWLPPCERVGAERHANLHLRSSRRTVRGEVRWREVGGRASWSGLRSPGPLAPSLPWIGSQAPCYGLFSQLAQLRRWHSYGASCQLHRVWLTGDVGEQDGWAPNTPDKAVTDASTIAVGKIRLLADGLTARCSYAAPLGQQATLRLSRILERGSVCASSSLASAGQSARQSQASGHGHVEQPSDCSPPSHCLLWSVRS